MTQSKQFNDRDSLLNQQRIILASSSPFRQKILSHYGIKFQAQSPKGDEKSITGLPPRILAAKRAEFKAIDVARVSPPESIIIGADQVLGFEGHAFDKSITSSEAAGKLKLLQGQTHILHSALCLTRVFPSGSIETIYECVVDIPMTMRPLSDEEITDYIATGEWEGCVGGYRAEGAGQKLFSNMGGDLSAIVGLPINELLLALQEVAQPPNPDHF